MAAEMAERLPITFFEYTLYGPNPRPTDAMGKATTNLSKP